MIYNMIHSIKYCIYTE